VRLFFCACVGYGGGVIFIRILLLIALAAGLGIAALFIIDALRPPTHNIGALFEDALVGGIVFVITLAVGGYHLFRK
jgi:hypothetical protein